MILPAQATDDPVEVTDVDVVLLGVKAWQVQEAARAMLPAIGPATFVVHCITVSMPLRNFPR